MERGSDETKVDVLLLSLFGLRAAAAVWLHVIFNQDGTVGIILSAQAERGMKSYTEYLVPNQKQRESNITVKAAEILEEPDWEG